VRPWGGAGRRWRGGGTRCVEDWRHLAPMPSRPKGPRPDGFPPGRGRLLRCCRVSFPVEPDPAGDGSSPAGEPSAHRPWVVRVDAGGETIRGPVVPWRQWFGAIDATNTFIDIGDRTVSEPGGDQGRPGTETLAWTGRSKAVRRARVADIRSGTPAHQLCVKGVHHVGF
jgi:hypothetical protein